MARQRRSFSPEFKAEAVKLVIESSRPVAHVARELGVNETTLSYWVRGYQREHGHEISEPALDVSERARLAELERVNQELRMENEFLKKAAAYFAQNRP